MQEYLNFTGLHLRLVFDKSLEVYRFLRWNLNRPVPETIQHPDWQAVFLFYLFSVAYKECKSVAIRC